MLPPKLLRRLTLSLLSCQGELRRKPFRGSVRSEVFGGWTQPSAGRTASRQPPLAKRHFAKSFSLNAPR